MGQNILLRHNVRIELSLVITYFGQHQLFYSNYSFPYSYMTLKLVLLLSNDGC